MNTIIINTKSFLISPNTLGLSLKTQNGRGLFLFQVNPIVKYLKFLPHAHTPVHGLGCTSLFVFKTLLISAKLKFHITTL